MYKIKTELIQEQNRTSILKLLYKLKLYTNENYVHSINVANICLKLGKEIGLKKEDISLLYTAGLVHDIGKLTIERNLFFKSNCSDEEVEHIRNVHILSTQKILSRVLGDNPIVDICYHHHERLNGTGYPQGLTSDELNLNDRILQIADIFSACAMKRSYKIKLSAEEISVILDRLVRNGEIDNDLVKIIKNTILNKYNSILLNN